MENANPIKTPMQKKDFIYNDINGKEVDTKVYLSMIGSLLYHVHLGLISFLVLDCALGLKHLIMSVTFWLLRASCGS